MQCELFRAGHVPRSGLVPSGSHGEDTKGEVMTRTLASMAGIAAPGNDRAATVARFDRSPRRRRKAIPLGRLFSEGILLFRIPLATVWLQ
jgi:hypothetical protein